MLDFAERLPAMREQAIAALQTRGLTRERVLGATVRLLDLGFFRIGGEEYAESNNTYGLATILREHVAIAKGVITFDYPAKSGKQRVQHVADEPVLKVVRALKARRGGGARSCWPAGPPTSTRASSTCTSTAAQSSRCWTSSGPSTARWQLKVPPSGPCRSCCAGRARRRPRRKLPGREGGPARLASCCSLTLTGW